MRIATVGAVLFLVNPQLGCVLKGDDFEYGEGEMRAAVEGAASTSSTRSWTMRVESCRRC